MRGTEHCEECWKRYVQKCDGNEEEHSASWIKFVDDFTTGNQAFSYNVTHISLPCNGKQNEDEIYVLCSLFHKFVVCCIGGWMGRTDGRTDAHGRSQLIEISKLRQPINENDHQGNLFRSIDRSNTTNIIIIVYTCRHECTIPKLDGIHNCLVWSDGRAQWKYRNEMTRKWEKR